MQTGRALLAQPDAVVTGCRGQRRATVCLCKGYFFFVLLPLDFADFLAAFFFAIAKTPVTFLLGCLEPFTSVTRPSGTRNERNDLYHVPRRAGTVINHPCTIAVFDLRLTCSRAYMEIWRKRQSQISGNQEFAARRIVLTHGDGGRADDVSLRLSADSSPSPPSPPCRASPSRRERRLRRGWPATIRGRRGRPACRSGRPRTCPLAA